MGWTDIDSIPSYEDWLKARKEKRMKTRTIVLIILTGMVVALAVELTIKATSFGESLEAFDTVLPVVTMGLVWLFSGQKSS